MSGTVYYAHTKGSKGERHLLLSHLRSTARMASEFAKSFGGDELARFISLLHDLGKANPKFQDYLEAQENAKYHPIVPHAPVGAALLYGVLKEHPWEEFVMPVAGHHAGLDEPGTLTAKLKRVWEADPDLRNHIQRVAVSVMREHNLSISLPFGNNMDPLRRELRIRMLFSALVDADYLDTEAHFDPSNSYLRKSGIALADLWKKFEKNQKDLMKKAAPSPVNVIRKEVYDACLDAAKGPKGIYKLTVPTGGGKTRSGLAFALKHALKRGLKRIIVAIPYTSIIDQTVQVYREMLGKDAVIEHHSQVSFPDDESQDLRFLHFKLASENWDAPLVVTTTVQLFESLFSNKPSRCRKLHNIAKSVIILDEVQTLPPELLEPTADVLKALVEEYGVTLVLSTATQPALEDSSYLKAFKGVSPIEIVSRYKEHFQQLKRVEYQYRNTPITFQELAKEIEQEAQILVVLNSRKDVLRLIACLKNTPHLFHLSTLLCGAHRKEILDKVRKRLELGEPVSLISTQVVEAGVDLDFPVVYRAVGPLDRIVQAAGRCNREGKMSQPGKMVVFQLEGAKTPKGPYKTGMEKAKLLIEASKELFNLPASKSLHKPEIYIEYFQRLFSDINLDEKQIQQDRKALNYPEVARKYRLIPEETCPVVVDYKDAFSLLDNWVHYPSQEKWRKLQLYVVNLYENELRQALVDGWIEEAGKGLYRWLGGYDEVRGILKEVHDPGDLIA